MNLVLMIRDRPLGMTQNVIQNANQMQTNTKKVSILGKTRIYCLSSSYWKNCALVNY